jgi:hypothetical protein
VFLAVEYGILNNSSSIIDGISLSKNTYHTLLFFKNFHVIEEVSISRKEWL